MNKLRIAVVGAGRLGGFHAQKLAQIEQVELVAIADPVESQRQRAAAECHAKPVADYRELIGQIDAAVVAVPTCLHHDVASTLLRHKIHLLVEKPLCSTTAEADALANAARDAQVVLQVGHVERFNPVFEAVQPRIAEPKYIEAVRTSGYTFRSTDIGAVLDIMIHDIDLVLALVDSRVRKVDAIGVSVLGKHEDVANARLEFQNGCVAVLNASRVSYESLRRMHIWSFGGFASIDFAARKATLVQPSDELAHRKIDFCRLTPDQWQRKEQLLQEHLHREEVESAAVDALALEDRDFVESILASRSPRVTGEHGRDAVAVAERILAKIQMHAWDDEAQGLAGPMAIPQPHILPASPFALASRRDAQPRREAG
jgi:predicted dehydrogenase